MFENVIFVFDDDDVHYDDFTLTANENNKHKMKSMLNTSLKAFIFKKYRRHIVTYILLNVTAYPIYYEIKRKPKLLLLKD